MANIERLLRDKVGQLLRDKAVASVVGFARGTAPHRSTPFVAVNEEQAGRLIFDATCGNNLALYLRRRRADGGRVGIVARGCDSRAIVQHIAEGQARREDVLIIGVPCAGVLDPRKVRGLVRDREVNGFRDQGETVVFRGKDYEITAARADVMSDSCKRCRHPNPPVFDEFISEPVPAPAGEDSGRELKEFESLEADERWAWFQNEYSRCIRCYACRNACPMCYCEECFVDQGDPQWFGKSTDPSDNLMYHIVRALHTAGRCVECGSCERACPVGINLGLLNQRVEREVLERFGSTAGLDPDQTPALAAFDEDDRQEFIL